MTRTIAMIARTTVEVGGQVFPAGRRFTAAPIEAAILRYQRKADFAPPGSSSEPPAALGSVVVAPATPAPDPPVEKPSRRRYRRRDLTADE